MVVAYKKGNLPNASQKIKQIAKGISLQKAQHFATSIKQKKGIKMKLRDLLTQDKIIQGKDYKISGFADKASGNITFKLISPNPQIIKSFRSKDFANIIAKVYRGGVVYEPNILDFKRTFTIFSINSYDTSQSSMMKVMNLIKDKIQKEAKI